MKRKYDYRTTGRLSTRFKRRRIMPYRSLFSKFKMLRRRRFRRPIMRRRPRPRRAIKFNKPFTTILRFSDIQNFDPVSVSKSFAYDDGWISKIALKCSELGYLKLYDEVRILWGKRVEYIADPDVLNTTDAQLSRYYVAYDPDAHGRRWNGTTDNFLINVNTRHRLIKPGTPMIHFLRPRWSNILTQTVASDGSVIPSKNASSLLQKSPWWDSAFMRGIPESSNAIQSLLEHNAPHVIKSTTTWKIQFRGLRQGQLYSS